MVGVKKRAKKMGNNECPLCGHVTLSYIRDIVLLISLFSKVVSKGIKIVTESIITATFCFTQFCRVANNYSETQWNKHHCFGTQI